MEPVLTYIDVLEKIVIDDEYQLSTNTTLGLCKGGDFYVKIDFLNLDLQGLEVVARLFELNTALKFQSELVTKAEYRITHIVTEKMNSSNGDYSMTWECFSDDPGFSLIID